jgi:hypothetical protein
MNICVVLNEQADIHVDSSRREAHRYGTSPRPAGLEASWVLDRRRTSDITVAI